MNRGRGWWSGAIDAQGCSQERWAVSGCCRGLKGQEAASMAGGVAWTGIGMVASQAVAFGAGVVLADRLGPAGLGRFQTVTALAACLALVLKLGMDEGVVFEWPRLALRCRSAAAALLLYVTVVPSVLGWMTGTVLAIGADVLESVIWQVPGVGDDLRALPTLLPVLLCFVMLMAVLRATGRIAVRATIQYWIVGGGFFLVVLCVPRVTVERAVELRTVSYGVGVAVALIVCGSMLKGACAGVRGLEVRRLHRVSSFMVLAGGFQYLTEQPLIDLVIVGRTSGAEAVGLYAVGAKLSSVVAVGANAVSVGVAPRFAEALARGAVAVQMERFERSALWMSRVSLCCGGVVILSAPVGLELFGAAYREAEAVVVVLALAQMGAGVLGPSGALLLAQGRGGTECGIGAASVVVMAGLGSICGVQWGMVGVAVATGVSLLVLNCSRYVAVRGCVSGTALRGRLRECAVALLVLASVSLACGAFGDGGWVGAVVRSAMFVGGYASWTWLGRRTLRS